MTVVDDSPNRSDRRLTMLAAVLAAVSVTCCATALVLFEGVGIAGAHPPTAGEYVLGTVWPVTGALIARARPRSPVGWLMIVPALLGPYLVAGAYAAESGGSGALGTVCAWFATWGFVPYFFTLPVIPHLFPDGRALSPRWRRVVVAVVGVAGVTTLARMFAPVTTDLAPAVTNPLGSDRLEWLNYVTMAGAVSLFVVGVPLAVASLAIRMRRAQDVERTQLYWLFLGGLVLALTILTPVTSFAAIGLIGFPLGIGIAILRHRLFDVELTLNRTVVLGVLTALVVAVYAAVVYGIQLVTPGSAWGVLLVAASALFAASARDRVQRIVDRLLFGHRHNPYAVVASVGREVAAASQPVDALQRLVEGLRSALRLPYVAFTGQGISVAAGTPTHGSRVVPVEALGESVGELHVGLRAPGETWTPQQTAAVSEVASRAGTLAYAAGLVVDVARSRGRIVAAREEERRRLRADLHDGVAPALAGTALQLESLARKLERDGLPDRSASAMALRDSLRGTVTELRALTHGLRPPVLDQLGLAGALRQLVSGHEVPRCEAEVGDLGDLPAALEVAAYAIGSEGFANALRHSAASRVTLSANVTGAEVVLTVVDNGIGLPARPRPGVGTSSMRDRATEVGGSLELLKTPGGGTTVRARLPLDVA